jgi:polysaccharide biosynthesis protein PslG
MSRYQFNPQLDPNRGRNRRLALMTLGIAAALVLAIGLVIFGINSFSRNIGAATPRPTAAVKLQVTIVAPNVQPLPTAVPEPTVAVPVDGALNPPTGQPGAPAPMDPRGAVAGAEAFACPSPRPAPEKFGHGIQSQWAVGDIGFFNTMMAETLGLNWTKAQVRWKDFETAPGKDELFNWQLLDAFMGDANKKGLNIMLGIIDAPAWTRQINEPGLLGPPDDFKEAARFFQKVAARYKGCVQAIEVWNEMNLDREWRIPSGKIAAADYVRFLDAVTPGVREIDPAILIVMGALSPTGASASDGGRDLYQDDYAYLDAFVTAGGPAKVDCVGVHLNGYNMPPDKLWNEGYKDPTAKFRGPFDNPNHSWSFKSTLFDYRAKTGKPLCITEFGWATMENLKRKDGTPISGPPAGFEFALDNTEQEQADWIVQGFQIMRESGFVRFAIVFNLDYIQKIGPEPDDPSANVAPYSITRRNGEPRPAFEAIKAMAK